MIFFVSTITQQSKTLYTTELDALKKLSTKKVPRISVLNFVIKMSCD
nr:MAG TPA: hypothetical protein [Caudoviricetes sp.]